MLSQALSGDVCVVKIGHGLDKGKPEETLCYTVEEARRFLDSRQRPEPRPVSGTTARSRGGLRIYTILESNRAFDVFDPDLAVFVEGSGGKSKASADRARRRADIVISPGTPLPKVEPVLEKKGLFDASERRRIGKVLREFHRTLPEAIGRENPHPE